MSSSGVDSLLCYIHCPYCDQCFIQMVRYKDFLASRGVYLHYKIQKRKSRSRTFSVQNYIDLTNTHCFDYPVLLNYKKKKTRHDGQTLILGQFNDDCSHGMLNLFCFARIVRSTCYFSAKSDLFDEGLTGKNFILQLGNLLVPYISRKAQISKWDDVKENVEYSEPLSINTTDTCARWKNRNPPNFVTKKPFGNYFRKYKTQFV